jgi:hypothetical protein
MHVYGFLTKDFKEESKCKEMLNNYKNNRAYLMDMCANLK